MRTAILAGVGVPLIMFLAWDAAILGSLGSLKVGPGSSTWALLAQSLRCLPGQTAKNMAKHKQQCLVQAAGGAAAAGDPLKILASENATVGPLIQAFSFLAVATSLVGFILGLTDFIADNLRVRTTSFSLGNTDAQSEACCYASGAWRFCSAPSAVVV